jgi:hypothetical protein
MRHLIRLVPVTWLLISHSAWSLEPPSIEPETRIRVTEIGDGPTRSRSGIVCSVGADTIALRLDGAGHADLVASIAWNQISLIEVSRFRGHASAGVGLGLLSGTATGALAGALGAKDWVNGSDFILSKKGVVLIWSGVGGIAGMVVGGLVGAHWKTEMWEAVPSTRWRLGARPGGFTLAFSVRL